MTYLAPVICTQYGKGVLMTPPNDARLHVPSYFSLTNDVPHSVRQLPARATSIYFYSFNQGTFVITIPSVLLFPCLFFVSPIFCVFNRSIRVFCRTFSSALVNPTSHFPGFTKSKWMRFTSVLLDTNTLFSEMYLVFI